MNRDEGRGVGLLVSVRSLEEARDAVLGGCAVLDVKEPANGPLGMADIAVVAEITGWARSRGVLTSAALGEVRQWQDGELTDAAPIDVDFAKMGVSGMADQDDWVAAWRRVRGRWAVARGWVAVAYADAQTCHAPPIAEVVQAAAAEGCAGVLLDTWDKSGPGLTECLDVEDLVAVRESTRQHGLLLALAGRVTMDEADDLVGLGPDLVAVRSAVCRHGRRTEPVSRERVTELVSRLSGSSQPAIPGRVAG